MSQTHTPSQHIIQCLRELELTTSTTAKKEILTRYPRTKLFWKLCYNPFWTYHVRDIPEPRGNVEGPIQTLEGKPRLLLRGLHERKYTGLEAQDKVHKVMAKCDVYTRDLLYRILQRDARCGVNIKLVNAVWPGLIPTHDVMLAQKIVWEKVKYPCIASIKIDGVRALVTKDSILTRAGKPIIGLDHLREQVPPGMMLDGELIIPGLSFQKSCGEIRSYNECPDAELHTFDLPEEHRCFQDRLEIIRQLSIWAPHIETVEYQIADNEQELREAFQDSIRRGYEGLVVKPLNYTYQRKRSKHWMKVKDMDSYDLKVVGKFEGTGKYKGAMGGLIVDFKGVEVRVGTGFSDLEREQLWLENVEGRIAEVECHEVTPDGSMRHPRFKGFRWDKEEVSHA